MLAQHFAEAGMQQVSRRVVAASGRAVIGIDYGVDAAADFDRLAHANFVRADALHRLHAPETSAATVL